MDKKQALISIIMPTYNRAEWLRRSIKSVLNQTYENWELLISDDGSTDDTKEVVKSFKDDRIKYFEFEQSGGYLGMARNRVKNEVRGEHVCFIDSDVEYKRDHLMVLIRGIERNSDFDFVYGDRMAVNCDTGEKVIGVHGDWDPIKLGYTNYIDTSDVLVRKEVLDKVGWWNEDIKKFADWALWVRFSKAGFKGLRIPIIITDYNVHQKMNQLLNQDTDAPNQSSPALWFDPVNIPWCNKETQPRVAIFTLTWNRLDFTKKMLDSVHNTTEYPFDWFVVDNGSTDGTLEFVKDKARVIKNKKNIGISKASNQALDLIGDDYDIIMKLDNDAEFMTDGWLEAIVDIWKINKMFVLSPRVEGLMDNPGGVPRSRYTYCGEYYLGVTIHLGGISVAAPKEAYEGFRWNEDDFLHGEQDIIFSNHVRKNKYTMAYIEEFAIEHLGKKNIQGKYDEQWQKARTRRN